MVEAFGEQCLKESGSRVFFSSDEFYLMGGVSLPPEEFYEGYPQIENGVGMVTSLKTEFGFAFEDLSSVVKEAVLPRRISVATGVAAYPHLRELCGLLENMVAGLHIHVYEIVNRFFGESITVAGLLTGQDMRDQLLGKDLGECLFIPENTLRADGDLFLCGMTPRELSDALGVRVEAAKGDGEGLLRDLLLK